MPGLGLGTSLTSSGLKVASHVTSNLKMLHRYNTGSVVPLSDGAAYFDAANNNYVAIGNQSNLSFGTGSFSVACWVLTTQTGTTSFILGKGSSTSTASSVGYALYFGNSGTDWVFSVGDGTDYALAQTNSLPTRNTNQWYHVCGTWDGSTKTAKIYQDGVLIDTDTDTDVGDIDNSDAFDIGRLDASTSNDWTGYVCNAGVWSGVLTQAQIKSIMWKNYAGLIDSEKTNLVSWWNLDSTIDDDGGARIVYDNHDTTYGSELNRNLGSADQWTAYSTNSVDLDDGAIHITGDGSNSSGAYLYLNDATNDGGLNTDLVVGQGYKLTCSAVKVGSGDAVALKVDSTANTVTADITSTTYKEINIYFIADHATNMLLNVSNLGSGEEIWLKDFSFKPFNGNPGELK